MQELHVPEFSGFKCHCENGNQRLPNLNTLAREACHIKSHRNGILAKIRNYADE